MNLKDPHGRISRWMMELNEFHFQLEHIPGKENILPDVLSRGGHEELVGAIADSLADSGNIEFYEIIAGLGILAILPDEEWVNEQEKMILSVIHSSDTLRAKSSLKITLLLLKFFVKQSTWYCIMACYVRLQPSLETTILHCGKLYH